MSLLVAVCEHGKIVAADPKTHPVTDVHLSWAYHHTLELRDHVELTAETTICAVCDARRDRNTTLLAGLKYGEIATARKVECSR